MRIHLSCHHEGTPLDNHLKAPVRGKISTGNLKPCKTVLKNMSKSHHHITSTVNCQQLCANSYACTCTNITKKISFFHNKKPTSAATACYRYAPALLLEECCMESLGLRPKPKPWVPHPGKVQMFQKEKCWSAIWKFHAVFVSWFDSKRVWNFQILAKYLKFIGLWWLLTQGEQSPKNCVFSRGPLNYNNPQAEVVSAFTSIVRVCHECPPDCITSLNINSKNISGYLRPLRGDVATWLNLSAWDICKRQSVSGVVNVVKSFSELSTWKLSIFSWCDKTTTRRQKELEIKRQEHWSWIMIIYIYI